MLRTEYEHREHPSGHTGGAPASRWRQRSDCIAEICDSNSSCKWNAWSPRTSNLAQRVDRHLSLAFSAVLPLCPWRRSARKETKALPPSPAPAHLDVHVSPPYPLSPLSLPCRACSGLRLARSTRCFFCGRRRRWRRRHLLPGATCTESLHNCYRGRCRGFQYM